MENMCTYIYIDIYMQGLTLRTVLLSGTSIYCTGTSKVKKDACPQTIIKKHKYCQ